MNCSIVVNITLAQRSLGNPKMPDEIAGSDTEM
jgi:hypothetical protein